MLFIVLVPPSTFPLLIVHLWSAVAWQAFGSFSNLNCQSSFERKEVKYNPGTYKIEF